mmetsp:Transcript_19047/g.60628  ORF Transcript_19047/g.60628 Transcript_19047/m.60628 type:complete len:233 (+) Transcript_19047:46-744(+)
MRHELRPETTVTPGPAAPRPAPSPSTRPDPELNMLAAMTHTHTHTHYTGAQAVAPRQHNCSRLEDSNREHTLDSTPLTPYTSMCPSLPPPPPIALATLAPHTIRTRTPPGRYPVAFSGYADSIVTSTTPVPLRDTRRSAMSRTWSGAMPISAGLRSPLVATRCSVRRATCAGLRRQNTRPMRPMRRSTSAPPVEPAMMATVASSEMAFDRTGGDGGGDTESTSRITFERKAK